MRYSMRLTDTRGCFPMIGAIIFLLSTEIDKFSETLIYVHYSAKVVFFIGITITKVCILGHGR